MTSTIAIATETSEPQHQRAVARWLFVCAGMVFAMAVIGAITRLSESGLSIMEWAPVAGILPPLSAAEWQRLFELYQQIPEYREENLGMSLAEFKTIFWWEYIHRLWGRLIGVVFLLPFLWFLVTKRLTRRIAGHLAAVFLLGGLQGGLGWFMVASGFAERTDVSQYRLVLHLSVAIVIYAYLILLALGLSEAKPAISPDRQAIQLRRGLGLLLALILATMVSGGFVAGLNAGMTYNTFPLMDGRLVPEGYAMLSPWPKNLFENVAAVQFNHRVLAMTTVAITLGLWAWGRRLRLAPQAGRLLAGLGGFALIQLGLGVWTLLAVVPLWLGAAHQAGALVLFGLGLATWHHLRPAPTS